MDIMCKLTCFMVLFLGLVINQEIAAQDGGSGTVISDNQHTLLTTKSADSAVTEPPTSNTNVQTLANNPTTEQKPTAGAANDSVTTDSPLTTSVNSSSATTVSSLSATTENISLVTTADNPSATTANISSTLTNESSTNNDTETVNTTPSNMSESGNNSSNTVTISANDTNTNNDSTTIANDIATINSSSITIAPNSSSNESNPNTTPSNDAINTTNSNVTPDVTSTLDDDSVTANTGEATTVPPNPCASSPCHHICTKINVTSYNCSCNHGYTISHDSHTCLDIDECQVNEGLCSGPKGMYCKNKPGSYDCVCMAGYLHNENTCIPAPKKFHGQFKIESVEVVLNGNTASLTGDTVNDKQNFQAAINVISEQLQKLIQKMKGFVGLTVTRLRKGSILIDFDTYFTSDGPSNSSEVKSVIETSLVTEGCDITNISSLCNITSLQGLNTSIVLNAANPCSDLQDHNCDPATTSCLPHTDGSFSCKCKPGYTRFPGTTFICVDSDECSLGAHTCNNKTSFCRNNIGSYTCLCNNGYISDSKGKCIDACATNPCEHEGRCEPGEGGYKCRCEGIWTGNNCEEEHKAALRYKMIAIIVGVLMGLLCLILLVSFLMACCRTSPQKVPVRTPQEVRMNEWEYEHQSPQSVGYQAVQPEGDEKDNVSPFTVNGSRTGSSGNDNPAYNPDQNLSSRTGT